MAGEGAARSGRLTRLAAGLGRVGRGVGRAVAATRIGRIAALLALCLVLFLPGIAALPVTDRDEARYAQATKQMLESGEFLDIRFQDEPRWKKPVGIYWMQAAAVEAAGGPEAVGIWAYRIPSLIGATAGVLATQWALAPLLGPATATLAAGLAATSMVLGGEANIAKTDAMLFALIAVMMGAWIRLLVREPGAPGRDGLRAALWGALGLAVLVKGPIAPAVLGLTALTLAAAERSLRPLAALGLWSPWPLLALLIAGPWFVAIGLLTDGAFYAEALGRDFIGKLREGQEAHGAPPGTYLGVAWAVFWPWAALALFAVPWLWAERRRRAVMVLAAWAVPFWIVLEATPTKLPHYLLPLAPALAGLVALWLAEGTTAAGRWRRGLAAVLFAGVGGGLALANLAIPLWLSGGVSPWGAALAVVGLGAVALGTAALATADGRGAATAMVLAGLCLVPATLQFGLPRAKHAFPSEAMARASAPFAACAGRPAASQSYREPSLVFLQGTGTRLLSVEDAARVLREEPGALVWAEDRRRAALDAALGEDAPALAELARVEAFNPNRGSETVLRLLARQGDPALAPCGAP